MLQFLELKKDQGRIVEKCQIYCLLELYLLPASWAGVLPNTFRSLISTPDSGRFALSRSRSLEMLACHREIQHQRPF